MKKLVYILILTLFSSQLIAQPFVGEVHVKLNALEERGDSLYLDLAVDVHRLAVNKCQKWTIIPELKSSDGQYVMTFPKIAVYGNNKRQMFDRRVKYRNHQVIADLPYRVVNALAGTGEHVRYILAVPFEDWMTEANLFARQILTSCADRDQLFTFMLGSSVDLEPREPYVAQTLVSFIDPEWEAKSRRMQGQAFLDFQVARTEIIPTFRRNPEELAKIQATIDQVVGDRSVEISAIFIEGYASPEGSYDLNDRLSRGRAESLKEYIRRQYSFPENLFRVSHVAEDWDGLRARVAESSINYRDQILDIIDGTDIFDGRESKLMRLGGGNPWRQMLTEMFPDLRRVEYQIDYSVRQYSLDESRNLIDANPESLNQKEFYTLAYSYGTESAEFERIMETALRHYPDDPSILNNNAAILIRRGEYAAARRMLERAGDNPSAWNNLGAALLEMNELDEAEQWLRKAARAGISEAYKNLEELSLKREDNVKMEKYSRRK